MILGDLELSGMTANISTTSRGRVSPPPGNRIEHEPLVAQQQDGGREDEDEEDDDLFDDESRLAIGKGEGGKPGLWVWLLVCTSCLTGLLFGYDTAIISSALVSLSTPTTPPSIIPPLNTSEKSIITSITSLSALLSSLISGPLCDRIGRKRTIFLSALIFILGALCQAFARSVVEIVIGRWIVGLGVGAGSAVVPLYITELSPAHLRSRLITMNAVFITFGQVIAYLIGFVFSGEAYPTGWRQMFAVGAVPAAVQLLLLFTLPESPRYLVVKGRREEAGRILRSVYGVKRDPHQIVERILRGIDRGIKNEHAIDGFKGRWKALWDNKISRKALYISGGLQAFQQLCGFNALMYFSATIFSSLGFHDPTLTSLTVSITNFLFTLLSLYLIPRLGKRRLLLASVPLMIIGLLAAALSFYNLSPSTLTTTPYPINSTISALDVSTQHPDKSIFPYSIVLATTFYVAAYAIGLGNIPWQQAEMFPQATRGIGTALATSCNWASNWIVGETFLGLMETLGATRTFVGFAGVCAIGLGGIWYGYPDTEGVGLEDVGEVLER